MKFRVCLLSIFCCLFSAVQVDAGQNSNAVISLDYVASGQGNQIDDGVMSGTVSGRGTTIVVEVFAKNVSTSLSAVEIIFKSSSVLSYVRAENPNTFIPVNLSNGVALTFANPLSPSGSGGVFLAKAEFTTLVDVANNEFKIGIEKVKLVENINNFDEITSGDEIVFNRSSTNSGSNRFQIVWPMDGDINYDGQVNVADFLLLVDNFGKTGTVPTSRMAIENALATGGSGTVITIRDTIYQIRTVRDTVYIGQVPPSNGGGDGGTPPTNTPNLSFDLDSDNGSPRDIMYANNRFYVVDWEDDKVYVYTSSGQRLPSADFDLNTDNISRSGIRYAGNSPQGITYANNRFYVVDLTADKVYVYTSSGQRLPSADFFLDSDNQWAWGITYANNRFYVVDGSSSDEKVYVYTSSGQYVPSADFDIDIDYFDPRDITYANNRFYMLDSRSKVYVYTSSGQRLPSADFTLDSDNSAAGGMTYANNRFYVVDYRDEKVYVYTSSE